MWGEELSNNSIERVMYGDNAAAIGLAHGTTTSSWRTRHLRIRSSLLKEALAVHLWRAIHLKGTELVADGCTKPLQAQAFFKFLEDLGMMRKHGQNSQNNGDKHQESGGGTQLGGGAQTATKAWAVFWCRLQRRWRMTSWNQTTWIQFL